MTALALLDWFAGNGRYMNLVHCMGHDALWIGITVALDLAVASGYVVIAWHWWRNQRHLPPTPAKRALGTMRNIFFVCGLCGYLFIPVKMVWPAWRLYDLFMAALVYFTWRYAWGAKDLKVIYSELGRSNRLAAELEKSQEESRRKSFFLNAISHDLRTPLNGLMLQANLAEAGALADDRETLAAAVVEIKAAARATADLLDNFLEYARLDWAEERNHVEAVELAALLRDAASAQHAAAAAKGLFLKVAAPAGLVIDTDRVKLDRIVTNLLTNAVKFTQTGGVRVEVERDASAVQVHVIDTGVGIAPEHHARLFDEFYQVQNTERDRRKGFGLGLTIARRLARQLGGDVTVESAPGSGSRFSIVLPASVRGANTGADGSKGKPFAVAS